MFTRDLTGAPAPERSVSGSMGGARAGGVRSWLRPGWPLYVVLALLLGSYLGLNQLIGIRNSHFEVAPWKPFVWELSSILVILALIPCVVLFERRFRLNSRPRGRILLMQGAGAVGFSLAHTTGMMAIRKLVYALAGQSYDIDNVPTTVVYELQKDVITYVVILLVIFAIREFRERRSGEIRAAQLAADLGEARLRQLTAQIEPHFLFNTLNAISNRMHEDIAAADRMISHLADLLRAAYDSSQQIEVPLERELDWLRGYALMMAERFRGQIEFELDVQAGLGELAVPRLLLQPIVENAFKHGLGDGHGRLEVRVRQEGSLLCYTVCDDGAGVSASFVGRGTGLANVSRRLEILFPNEHTLTVAAHEPAGTIVTVRFPIAT